MTGGDWLGIVSALITLVLGLGVYFNTRRERRNAENATLIAAKAAETDATEAETAEALAKFGVNIQLMKFIEETVKAQVAPVQKELAETRLGEARRTRAMTRILRSIEDQWPTGAPGPHLDPADIAEVEETIPTQWLPKGPTP
jgi:ABC-type protease/lipase transport system fused ATPase/permease subunit